MCLAAAAIVAAVVAVGVRQSDRSSPSAFQPSGSEFPIADLGPATRHEAHGVTLTELSRDIGVAGTWQLTVEAGLDYQGGESPVEVRCIEGDGSAMCVPEYAEAGVSVYRTATVEGSSNPRLWAWAAVPAGSAYVTYTDGQLSLWQRPIDRVAVFPDVYDGGEGDSEVAIAYSIDGVELGRVDRDRRAAVQTDQENRGISVAELAPSQEIELDDLTDGSLTTCLTQAGASFDGAIGNVAIRRRRTNCLGPVRRDDQGGRDVPTRRPRCDISQLQRLTTSAAASDLHRFVGEHVIPVRNRPEPRYGAMHGNRTLSLIRPRLRRPRPPRPVLRHLARLEGELGRRVGRGAQRGR